MCLVLFLCIGCLSPIRYPSFSVSPSLGRWLVPYVESVIAITGQIYSEFMAPDSEVFTLYLSFPIVCMMCRHGVRLISYFLM